MADEQPGGGGSPNESAEEEQYRRRLLVSESIGNARLEQMKLYDPEQQSFWYCRGYDIYRDDGLLDHEEESMERIARPLDTIPESQRNSLELALGVLYVKVLASEVGFPISVFGTILMRDELDSKCIYLFKRDRDNCQIINSPGEMLMLTGPNRGPFDACEFFFEINLRIKGDEETMDRIFSRTLEVQGYPLDQWTKKNSVSSWLSTLELAYRSVYYAVEATVGIKIMRGPRVFYGKLTACSSDESNEMVLYDSERWGASEANNGDGSVPLPRCLLVIREDECLILKVSVFRRHGLRANKPKTFVLTVEHSDKSFDIKIGHYQLQVTVSWAGILT